MPQAIGAEIAGDRDRDRFFGSRLILKGSQMVLDQISQTQ
jgi:hypothetical protein